MRPDVKLTQLRYFVLVAETRSHHAAAEQAARTQPAVSQAIRELEERLGAALFERGRKTELTPFGRECYPQAKALLDHYERTVDQLTQTAQRRSGRVAVASVPSFAAQRLPAILARFAALHPGIQVAVEDDTAPRVQQRVLEHRVDFGIGSRWGLDSELDFRPLLRDPMGLVCRADDPLAREPEPRRWRELRGRALISNGTLRLLDGTAAQAAVTGARFHVPNMISLLAMVRAGLGVTILPRLALPPDDPDLRFVPLRSPQVEREIGLLTTRRRSLSPAAEALHETIVADGPAAQAESRPRSPAKRRR